MPWLVDAENNRIVADDQRSTIVCNLSATCRNPDVMKDARLIAAAPDLLAALQYLADQIPLGTLNVRKDFSLINAHAGALKAIAKATGK